MIMKMNFRWDRSISLLANLVFFWVGLNTLGNLNEWLQPETQFDMIWPGTLFVLVMLLLFLSFYTYLYIKQPALFMKFKFKDTQWPWETNLKRWKKRLPKVLCVFVREYLSFHNVGLVYSRGNS